MSMPLIGISGSMNDPENQIFLVRSYMQVILHAGGVPVLLSPDMEQTALEDCLDQLDGLMLAGGGDVVPSRFGEEPIQELGETTPVRDEFELRLLPAAIRRNMPVLGICRGIQVMNVALGGTLYQDLPAQYQPAHPPLLAHKQTQPYETPTHSVELQPSSQLYRLTGQKELQVNSMHHQAIEALADGLMISGRAADGTIEAVECLDLPFFLGVQWHPERLSDEASHRLFAGFVEAAQTYRRNRL